MVCFCTHACKLSIVYAYTHYTLAMRGHIHAIILIISDAALDLSGFALALPMSANRKPHTRGTYRKRNHRKPP